MAAVYSKLFCSEASFTDGPMSVFTVPDGFLAVVKCLSIVYGNVTDSGIELRFRTKEKP